MDPDHTHIEVRLKEHHSDFKNMTTRIKCRTQLTNYGLPK